MKSGAISLESAEGRRNSWREQVTLVVIFAALALAARMLPLMQGVHIRLEHYLLIHTFLEFASILAAFLVFATVWHTPAKETSASLLMIAAALFASGWLDFAHAMSLKGMPGLITPASVEKSIAFGLVARLLVALTLLGVSFYPQLRPLSGWGRYGILAGYTLVNSVVIWAVVFYETDLPKVYIEASGPPLFRSGFELLITGVLALAAWRYSRLERRSSNHVLPLLFAAASISALSGLFFIDYKDANDLQSLIGHLFKVVSYALIYLAMFVVSIRKPYQLLAAQTQIALSANERLRTQSLALESTAIPVLVTDLHGMVHWTNQASRGTNGVQSPELENGNCLFSAPITPDPKMAETMRATVEAGNIWRGYVHVVDPLGNRLIMNRIVTPLRNEEGVIEGYVSVGENVTESTRALLRHKRVLDTATDGFWITDMQGRLLEVNEACARMSGYSVEELLGMNINQLTAIEFADQIHARMATIIEQGQSQFESHLRHKQGHEFPVDIAATYDSESKTFFVFSHDRSNWVQATAAKRDLERQLRQSQKMQALGQLTGGIAHDFNNILAAILGYSNLALDRFVPDKQSKLALYLGEVVSASERARDLIAKMLTFTRTQANASVGVIFPALVIKEVVAMMRPSIPASIQFSIHIDDDLPICMDAGELNQVLVNLIINARDAIQGHGMIGIGLHRVEVHDRICAVSLQRLSGTYLALEVSDNGSGIAPEHLARLFEPFFTTKDIGKGTGLGLSMVQGILGRARGHVVVESQPGRGSRFQLLFPIALPPETSSDVQTIPQKAQSGAGQQIWVVDDESTVARFLRELIEEAGYRVRLFSDPTDALTAFEARPNEPDLLLTDQTMPGLSGLALALRVHSLRPTLPIILCTGYGDGLDGAEARRHGIRRYFSKPVSSEALLKALAEELVRVKF